MDVEIAPIDVAMWIVIGAALFGGGRKDARDREERRPENPSEARRASGVQEMG
jgi:hypothetical protein